MRLHGFNQYYTSLFKSINLVHKTWAWNFESYRLQNAWEKESKIIINVWSTKILKNLGIYFYVKYSRGLSLHFLSCRLFIIFYIFTIRSGEEFRWLCTFTTITRCISSPKRWCLCTTTFLVSFFISFLSLFFQYWRLLLLTLPSVVISFENSI